MRCKKCRKQIPDDAKFCCYCGQKVEKGKMYRRPDGLYEKVLTIDGKRVYFRAKTEREVERKIVEFQGVKERGPLFQEIADQWEEEHFPTLAYNTQKSYRAPLRRATERFGALPIRDIEPSQISVFLASVAAKRFSQKTIKTQLLVLNLIFQKAVISGLMQSNPAQYVKIPKGLSKKKRSSPQEEQIELVKSHYHDPFGMLALFLLYTGLRKGEALALQFKDIDRMEKLIHVSKSVYFVGNSPKIKSPKTEKGIRSVILIDILAEKLPSGKPNDLVFPGKNGLMTASEFNNGWNAYCKGIGLYEYKEYTDKDGHTHNKIVPHLTPHQLRHGFATMLHDAGLDPKDSQDILGHTTIAMTMDVYTDISATRKKEIFQKLNEYANSTQ